MNHSIEKKTADLSWAIEKAQSPNVGSSRVQDALDRFQDAIWPLREASDRYQDAMRPFLSKLERSQAKLKRSASRIECAFNFDFPKAEIKFPEGWAEEGEWAMKRFRAARANPDDAKSKLWLALAHLDPTEVRDFKKYLPDPRVKPGRPTGRGCYASDETLMPDMDRLVGEGKPPKTAARILLLERGYGTGIPDKAGYVAKLYKVYLASGKK